MHIKPAEHFEATIIIYLVDHIVIIITSLGKEIITSVTMIESGPNTALMSMNKSKLNTT